MSVVTPQSCYKPITPVYDINGLTTSMDVYLPITLRNREPVTLYFEVDVEVTNPNILGTYPAKGSAQPGQMILLIVGYRRSLPSVNPFTTETIKLVVKAYTDPSYTQLYGTKEVDVTVVYLDSGSSSWSQRIVCDFDTNSCSYGHAAGPQYPPYSGDKGTYEYVEGPGPFSGYALFIYLSYNNAMTYVDSGGGTGSQLFVCLDLEMLMSVVVSNDGQKVIPTDLMGLNGKKLRICLPEDPSYHRVWIGCMGPSSDVGNDCAYVDNVVFGFY